LLVALVSAEDRPVAPSPEIILPEIAHANYWLEDALWRAGITDFMGNDSLNMSNITA
jgi:hypothetical protein